MLLVQALAIVLLVCRTTSFATTALDICPDQNPCHIRTVIAVTENSTLDFGLREVVVDPTGGLRMAGGGTLMLSAVKVTIQGRIDLSSGVNGGTLTLFGRDGVEIHNGGSIIADGAERGGRVKLEARAPLVVFGGTGAKDPLAISVQATSPEENDAPEGGQITLTSSGPCTVGGILDASAPNGEALNDGDLAGHAIRFDCESLAITGVIKATAGDAGGLVDLRASGGSIDFRGKIDASGTAIDASGGSVILSAAQEIVLNPQLSGHAIDAGPEDGDTTIVAGGDVRILGKDIFAEGISVDAGYDIRGRTASDLPCFSRFAPVQIHDECQRRFGDLRLEGNATLDTNDEDGSQIFAVASCDYLQGTNASLRGTGVVVTARGQLTIQPGGKVVTDEDGPSLIFRNTPPSIEGACFKRFGTSPCGSTAPTLEQNPNLIGCNCDDAVCDDLRPCTADSCDSTFGCVQTNFPDGTACGDLCTSVGVCGGGTCSDFVPVDCNDGDPCTSDSCDPAMGCTNAPACGDGLIQPQCGEACDGPTLGGATCQSVGFDGGALSCFPPSHPQHCLFDTSLCRRCGNGMVEPGELCDGADLGGATCQSRGYAGGTLSCSDCQTFDESACFFCGDAQINPGEECDRENLGGAACNGPGETGGLPQCTTDCRLDRRTCFSCGNGHVDPHEECDDGNVVAGDGCRPDCRLECGNGTVERNEECDDGNRAVADGCSSQCAREQPFGGGGARQECALEWGVEGGEASRRQECRDGDATCDRGTTSGQCDFLVFYCFNVAEFVVGEPAACVPRDIAQLAIRSPSLLGSRALSAANVDSLFGAMGATLARGGATATRSGAFLTASPPMASRRQCGAVLLSVPLRATAFGMSRSRRLLSIDVTDSAGDVDRDTITFLCNP
jgi:cysteine-rich repeat protein